LFVRAGNFEVDCMGDSSQLRLSDINLAHRIVNECRELWMDPAGWRQHLVEGACELTGITVAHYTEALIPSPASAPRFLCHAATGFPGTSDWKIYQASLAAYPNLFDFFIGSQRLLQNLTLGKPAVALREDLCSNRRWYLSEVYNEYRRPIRGDGNVISIVQHEPSICTVLDVNQNSFDARPTGRTKRQLAYLHQLVDPLIGTELATEHQRGIHGLSPQLRATLEQLLAGDGEKQIATSLGLRHATVHEYVGKIYRHFGVRSRAELMAYFIRRRPEPR
jgi:DNA-binding CsgD family transcriptional regulator